MRSQNGSVPVSVRVDFHLWYYVIDESFFRLIILL